MLMLIRSQSVKIIKERCYQTCATLAHAHTHKPNTTNILVTMCNLKCMATTQQPHKIIFCNLVVRTCCLCLIAPEDHRGAHEQVYAKTPTTTPNTTKALTINTWIPDEEEKCNRSSTNMEKAKREETKTSQRCWHTVFRNVQTHTHVRARARVHTHTQT